MRASTCTPWTEAPSSTHSPSAPTDTGCVLPQGLASRSGYVLHSPGVGLLLCGCALAVTSAMAVMICYWGVGCDNKTTSGVQLHVYWCGSPMIIEVFMY